MNETDTDTIFPVLAIDMQTKIIKEKSRTYQTIKAIYIETGGFPCRFTSVKIDFAMLLIKNYRLFNYYTEEETIFHPLTPEKAEAFLDELQACAIFEWNSDEETSVSLKGPQWNIQIDYGIHLDTKRGYLQLPTGWPEFCKAVTKVSGSEFY